MDRTEQTQMQGAAGAPRDPVHFLLHVPKCAGTTVERHFEAHLGRRFLIAPRWESVLRNVVGNRYPYAPGDARLEGVRVVSGHSLSRSLAAFFPYAEICESVLLRDPVGYHISLYNYRWAWHAQGHAPEPPEWWRWYAVQRRNPILRFLLTRYFEQGVPALYRLSSAGRLAFVEARLARFWFVGDFRRAGELIGAVSRELGVSERVEDRNVTQEKVVTRDSLGEGWAARIMADNAADAALHERWRDRGFCSGAPEGPPPRLSRTDQPAALTSDLWSGLARKLQR